MSYLPAPNYIETIAWKYPTLHVSCADDPMLYDSINWMGEIAITKTQLDVDQFELYKSKISDRIRKDATVQRFKRTNMVLGTDDPEQIRTYEEKNDEAVAYAADNLAPTPIMTAETSHTGESVDGLAPMVVTQYAAAKVALRTMFGNIEGERRRSLYIIGLYTTLTQLEAYPGPNWT